MLIRRLASMIVTTLPSIEAGYLEYGGKSRLTPVSRHNRTEKAPFFYLAARL